ncbi:stage IV sporulation protein A [uncultured Ruminococcus sp.]|uniref:stage IV sporulation protein A n=1 Tax=uncultured Ruminococcus sp. TaxID=165186 RepID=UPI00292E0275|nr:stage IV sporulation protein A [uncultured Ruminococcus sp.]
MEERSIYKDIENRTGGNIYIGVVGPVRTGKSTFIKRFMDTLVLPRIKDDHLRERALDELPQSAAGRTIMTTEPKFVPENAVPITLEDNARLSVRMIDCVGYIVDSAMGYIEDDGERMVHTPWSDREMPFRQAAELGTKKVITDHSTIGVMVTTDGSIGDIGREDYVSAEERVAAELTAAGKPFIILLNTTAPESASSSALAANLSQKYGAPTVPVDCAMMDENTVKAILATLLFEFPIREIHVELPEWLRGLGRDNWLRADIFGSIRDTAKGIAKIREVQDAVQSLSDNENIDGAELHSMDLGTGRADITVRLRPELFYRILTEKSGIDIHNERELMECICELAQSKSNYDRIGKAYEDVLESGYGIVMPTMEELSLEEPEIVRQSGKYGIRLKASAPSVHMMRVRTTAEVTPIVGSEQQSEELVTYLLKEFEESPAKIWDSNIFGKSVSDLVGEGLNNKLCRMPEKARLKIGETVEKIINDGCNGLICIIL